MFLDDLNDWKEKRMSMILFLFLLMFLGLWPLIIIPKIAETWDLFY